jgi:Ca2+:H+ antiporter
MAAKRLPVVPLWSVAIPVVAIVVLAAAWGRAPAVWLVLIIAAALVAAVMTAVHHAEVVAHRVGEPFGSLVLAVAVTIIEVSLVVSMMISGGASAATLARDTVFAAVMIVCTGVIGLCLLAGGLRHHVIAFRIEGTSPVLATLAALVTLTLVLPTYTTSTPGPTFSTSQLVFAGAASLALYGVFVFVQTVRHRDYFLPADVANEAAHAPPVTTRIALISMALLGLAKALSPSIEAAVHAAEAPEGVVGITIALLVLLPESWAALRAAAANRVQTSINLALGSALASIGLTIPAVAAVSIFLGLRLELGLPPKEIILLALTAIVATLTLGGGRATVLQGAVHMTLFAVFLFLAVVP